MLSAPTCMYALVMPLGFNFFVALVLAMALGVALGAAIEILLLSRLRGADIDTTMLVMIGAWIVLQNTEQLVWSRRGACRSPIRFHPSHWCSVPLSVSWDRVYVFVIALPADRRDLSCRSTARGWAKRCARRFRIGIQPRLWHPDRPHRYRHVRAWLRPRGRRRSPTRSGIVVTPTMDLVAAKAFAIVILGGLGNVVGDEIGGFILAFTEEIGAGYISSGYRDAMASAHHLDPAVRPTGLSRGGADRVSSRLRYLPWLLVARPRRSRYG